MATEGSSGQIRSEPRLQALWFWAIFSGGVFIIGCLILFVGIRKTVAAAHWTRTPDETLFYLALGVVGGIGLFIYGFVVNRRKRLIESTPSSPVRSLAVGLVEVSGHAQPEGELLRAPFSGIPCVLFSYEIEKRRGSGKDARWKTIAKGTSEQPFFVHDATGKVLVVPFGARLILSDNRTTRNNWFGSLPDQAIVGLSQLGISVDGWLGQKTIRCSEACILPEEAVYVLGVAHEKPGAAGSAENAARLYIGGSRDQGFIISDRSEKELLSGLRWQVFALFAGGSSLAVTCLLIIFKTYVAAGR
jgi:uncharacterized membrane protein YsdA (DUF1294 family)